MIKKIYFDMDGVLADFNRGILELCKMNPLDQGDKTEAQDDEMWAEVKKLEHFYNKLEPMPGAIEMFEKIWALYGDKCEILSGIPKPRRGILNAGEDKTEWAHRLLRPDLKVNIVFREEKIKYCSGKDCILIDDYKKNIKEWEACGGSGILYESPEATLEALHNIEKALRES